MLLWGLSHYLDCAPDNEEWEWGDTETIFPEMEGICDAVDGTLTHDPLPIRKAYLEKAIKSLTKKLKQ
jgi:hypothetical protein